MHRSPAPSPPSPASINDQIRHLAASAARAGMWSPGALAELDVLYRAWHEALEAEGEPAAA